jgi:Cd2+/Zn2+-exporting ATPase
VCSSDLEELGALTPALDASLPRESGDGSVTVSIVGTATGAAGVLEMEDELRAEAPAAVHALRALGIGHIVMLTGDRPEIARAIGEKAGIATVIPELLPEDKLARVRELVGAHGSVAMVGDGVNDAPALALSTVGIAMGAAGSPAAIETADVALMTEDLRKIPHAIVLGRRMVGVVRQNVAVSLALKAGFHALAVAGYATMWMAVAADMGTTLLVIGNGLRLLRDTPAGV